MVFMFSSLKIQEINFLLFRERSRGVKKMEERTDT